MSRYKNEYYYWNGKHLLLINKNGIKRLTNKLHVLAAPPDQEDKE